MRGGVACRGALAFAPQNNGLVLKEILLFKRVEVGVDDVGSYGLSCIRYTFGAKPYKFCLALSVST